MDLWVVAAAAGAGYLAKYWKNIFRDREGLSGVHSGNYVSQNPLYQSLVQQKNDKTYSIGDVLCGNTDDRYFNENGHENHSGRSLAEKSCGDGPSTMEVTSTITLDHGKQVENYNDGDMPLSVFPPECSSYENYEHESGYRLGSDLGDIPEHHIWGTGSSHTSRRSGNSLRRKCLPLQFIRPRSSLDSCLVAQMCKEHEEMEDYVLSPLPSPCTPTLRPFLVTDGRRLIGRASGDFRDGLYQEGHPKPSGVVGVPYLPRIVVTDYSKQKFNVDKNRMRQMRNNSALVRCDSGIGFSSGQFLFCLGISIGVMYTIVAQKLEVEKLKESLTQSENLVQDLQEELEMKDSLTVKELVIDDSSQGAYRTSCVNKEVNMFLSQVDTSVLIKRGDEESISLKEGESMRTIEAELEAELERLELSMNDNTVLQERLLDAIELEHELDEDMVAELIHGELRADVVRRKSSSEPTPNRGSSSTSTPFSAKNGVSPRELSLRLHEVIQSRLQNQVMELEAELAKTQKRVQHLESERVNSWRDVWNSESSSNPSTPVVVEAHSPVTTLPIVMNLSGDALDAYNEAFEELSKIKGSQNEDPSKVNGHKDNQLATHQVLNGNPNGNRDFDMTWLGISGEEPMPDGSVQIPFDEESPNCSEGDDDDDDLILIKQIVEKARQGSPAILRAQRAMVSLERE